MKSNKLLPVLLTAASLGFFALNESRAQPEPASDRRDWVSLVPAASVKGAPRVLLIHDMEGLSGQDDPYTFLYGHPQYAQGRKLLTADVNAVIDGLFAGGAAAVTVADGHGSGNPEADVLVDQLDRRAQLVTRAQPFDTYLDLAEQGAFDAIAVVGMHAKSGSGGFASHTYSIGSQIIINGHSITETELVALLYGRIGVPVVFASGDDRLAADLRTMPWIQYVTTKRATSASTAELYPVASVHDEMTRKARLALEQLADAKVMRTQGLVKVGVRAVSPASLRWLAGMPGIDYRDDTASFLANDMAAAYRGIRPLMTALGFSFSDASLSAFNALPDAQRLRKEGAEELYRRWFESETAGAPVLPPRPPAPRGEYHGFR